MTATVQYEELKKVLQRDDELLLCCDKVFSYIDREPCVDDIVNHKIISDYLKADFDIIVGCILLSEKEVVKWKKEVIKWKQKYEYSNSIHKDDIEEVKLKYNSELSKKDNIISSLKLFLMFSLSALFLSIIYNIIF